MKRYAWVCSGVLGAAALAGSASAQGVHGMFAPGTRAPAYACPTAQYCPRRADHGAPRRGRPP